MRHFTQCHCNTRLKRSLGISIRILKGWKQKILYLLWVKVLKTLSHALNSCIFNLSFIVIQKGCESLKKVAISNIFAKSISKFCKVLGKSKSNFPRFVFTNCN